MKQGGRTTLKQPHPNNAAWNTMLDTHDRNFQHLLRCYYMSLWLFITSFYLTVRLKPCNLILTQFLCYNCNNVWKCCVLSLRMKYCVKKLICLCPHQLAKAFVQYGFVNVVMYMITEMPLIASEIIWCFSIDP